MTKTNRLKVFKEAAKRLKWPSLIFMGFLLITITILDYNKEKQSKSENSKAEKSLMEEMVTSAGF